MRNLLVALFAVVTVAGCATERPVESYNVDNPDAFTPYSSTSIGYGVELLNGYLAGSIGTRTFRGTDVELDGYNSDGYTDVSVILTNANGDVGMAALTFDGGIDNPRFQPGTVHTFSMYEVNEPYLPRLEVYGLVCSGEEIYDWDYDAPIDNITLSIDETADPDVVAYNFDIVTIHGQESSGGLDVLLP